MFGICLGYLGNIFEISWGYPWDILGTIGPFVFGPLVHWSNWDISGISWGYLGDILGISWGYLGDIMGISWGYLGGIIGLSWGYLGGILEMVRKCQDMVQNGQEMVEDGQKTNRIFQ